MRRPAARGDRLCARNLREPSVGGGRYGEGVRELRVRFLVRCTSIGIAGEHCAPFRYLEKRCRSFCLRSIWRNAMLIRGMSVMCAILIVSAACCTSYAAGTGSSVYIPPPPRNGPAFEAPHGPSYRTPEEAPFNFGLAPRNSDAANPAAPPDDAPTRQDMENMTPQVTPGD